MSEMDFKNVQDEDCTIYTRHFGAVIPIGQRLDGEPKYVLGPHYLVFFGTWIFSCCLSVFILKEMYQMLTTVWFLLTLTSNIIFLISYINVGFSYPGIASRFEQPSEQTKAHPRFCKPCKIIREPGTVHCLDCDLCIYGHDHHCPWIGKCVGGSNISDFYFFLCMCFGNLIFILICVLFGQNQMNTPK